MFIEITRRSGPVLINVASIGSVEADGEGSKLHLSVPNMLSVQARESYTEIKQRLRDSGAVGIEF
jgi:hypothetical protein